MGIVLGGYESIWRKYVAAWKRRGGRDRAHRHAPGQASTTISRFRSIDHFRHLSARVINRICRARPARAKASLPRTRTPQVASSEGIAERLGLAAFFPVMVVLKRLLHSFQGSSPRMQIHPEPGPMPSLSSTARGRGER